MSIEQEADDFAAEESANDVVEVAEDVQEATPGRRAKRRAASSGGSGTGIP